MNETLYLLINFLSTNKYKVEHETIRQRLFSDPNNELVAITNTLDFFNIKNIAATIPAHCFEELPACFFAQVISKSGKHRLVLVNRKTNDLLQITLNEKKQFDISKEEFMQAWTGLVILTEKSSVKQKVVNPKLAKEITLLLSSALMIVTVAISIKDILAAMFLLLSFLGIYISWLLFSEKLHTQNTRSKVCGFYKITDCKEVINSKQSKVFRLIDLTDIALVYFLFITTSFIISPKSWFFLIISGSTIPIVVYSVYSQYYVIKKWCPLCLSVGVILIIQFTILTLEYASLSFNVPEIFLILAILGIIIIAFINVKALLRSNEEKKQLYIENLSFKRNYHLFLPYYESLKRLKDDLNVHDQLRIGSSNPILQITYIINPLCQSCKQSFKIIQRLMQQYPNELQLNIRFLVDHKDKKSNKTLISLRLIQLYFESRLSFEQAITEWSHESNAKAWFEKWGYCTDTKYSSLLLGHIQWCFKNDIAHTPTLLLNNKKLPDSYHAQDIENFIEPLLGVLEPRIEKDFIDEKRRS